MRRANVVIAAVAGVSIAAAWIVPSIGVIAVAIMLALAPPWGRSIAERTIISAMLVLSTTFVIAGGAADRGSLDLRVILAVLLVIGVALRFTPMLASVRIPRPRVSDGILVLVWLATWFWLGGASASSAVETWSIAVFASSMTALAWMAGDLAERFAKLRDVSMAAAGIVAVLGFGAFVILGSTTWLFNEGLTGLVLAVSVTGVAGYLSARSWQSARKIGWFLIPVAAVAVFVIQTPLILGFLLPAGLVVASLGRTRWWLAAIWTAAIALGTLWLINALTSFPLLSIEPTSFNRAAAIAFPIIALISAGVLVRERNTPIAIAIMAGPIGAAALAFGAPTLLTLNALLIAGAPLIAALMSVVVVIAVKSVGRVMAVAGSVTAVVLGVVVFGSPVRTAPAASTIGVAVGVLAHEQRQRAIPAQPDPAIAALQRDWQID